MADTALKGRELEQRMCQFLEGQGYRASCNEFLVGRSGVTHEVDVVAEKSDGVLAFRVVIECKNWAGRVDKAVIAKVAHVAADLGVNKAVVACAGGCEPGAMQIASDLGVEIWGPEEIAQHLGALTLRELRDGGTQAAEALGFPVTAPADAASRAIARDCRGKLGFASERIVREALVWVPAFMLTIGVARVEGRRKKEVRHSQVRVVYEALGGRCLHRGMAELGLEPVALRQPVMTPAFRPRQIEAEIRKASDSLLRVTQVNACARHAETLRRLGVLDSAQAAQESSGNYFRGAEIDETQTIVQPVYLATTERKGAERVVAFDAYHGELSPVLSEALTAQLTALRSLLDSRQAAAD